MSPKLYKESEVRTLAVKLTLEQLENLLSYAKNRVEFGDMRSYVLVSVKKHPNDKEYVEFEQPCIYPECNSIYHRF